MKILYFHQHFTLPQGSGGVRSYQLARLLIEQGHEVIMVCGQCARSGVKSLRPLSKDARIEVDGITVIELPLPYSNHDGFVKRSITFLRYALKSVKIALTEPCDLVFATSTPLTAAIPGIAARWLRRKPFVFEVRDLWPELPREMGVIRNPLVLWLMSVLEWLAYRSASGCIGLSPGIVEGIRKRSAVTLPVAMVPNGCDLDLFDVTQNRDLSQLGLPKGKFYAVFAGTHGVANGLDQVLDAAAVLQERGRLDIGLVLMGDGKLKAKLQRRAIREDLRNVTFLDPIPKLDLARFLGRFDVGMQVLTNVPAFYFGTSPNKFFDYLSAGLPVLNNYPGWLADLIAEHDCGVVVRPDDPESFAEGLMLLADNPGRCVTMRKNARRLAEVAFSRKQLGTQWIEFVVGIGAGKV